MKFLIFKQGFCFFLLLKKVLDLWPSLGQLYFRGHFSEFRVPVFPVCALRAQVWFFFKLILKKLILFV